MTKSRKDNKGRVLRKGETQRSCDGKYVYTYTDPEGKRRSIYSKDIMELRVREEKLIKDQLDGLDTYVAGSATVNFVFDRYISTKSELRGTTMRNYKYMYDRFINTDFYMTVYHRKDSVCIYRHAPGYHRIRSIHRNITRNQANIRQRYSRRPIFHGMYARSLQQST